MSAQIFAFQPTTPGNHATTTPPEPHRNNPDILPDREWGLSAGQVVAVVLVIVAACELFALIF